MDVQVTGRAKVFRNERQGRDGQTFTNYSTSLARKNKAGEWENASIEVRFRKGNEPSFNDAEHPDRVDIEIESGFLTFRKYTDKEGKGHNLFYVMVLDYKKEEGPRIGYYVDDDFDENDLPF